MLIRTVRSSVPRLAPPSLKPLVTGLSNIVFQIGSSDSLHFLSLQILRIAARCQPRSDRSVRMLQSTSSPLLHWDPSPIASQALHYQQVIVYLPHSVVIYYYFFKSVVQVLSEWRRWVWLDRTISRHTCLRSRSPRLCSSRWQRWRLLHLSFGTMLLAFAIWYNCFLLFDFHFRIPVVLVPHECIGVISRPK